jgi:hydroxypyruvate isomerase
MYLSACIEWLFSKEHPEFCDRIRAAKAAGLTAVEFHLWQDKPLEAVRDTLRETGLHLTSFVVEPRRSLVDPAQHAEFLAAVTESLDAARRLDCPALVVASGFTRPEVSHEEQHDIAVGALRRAAKLAEAGGVMLVLEPLNTKVEHPGMFLSSTVEALDMIDEVASPKLKLLYDLYHSTIMGERVADVLTGRIDQVAHVQVADAPGRHEPGSGGIDFRDALDTLRRLGYDGALGLEYKPSEASLESLARTRAALGI